jgi:hypothetical protein
VAKKESLETHFNHLSLEDNMPILPPPIFRQLDASDIELMIGGSQDNPIVVTIEERVALKST